MLCLTVYNLQREAPKPLPILCSRPLPFVPDQYGVGYHGSLSRQATEEILAGQPSGSYLIRDSQRADDAFTLAIRYVFSFIVSNVNLSFDEVTRNYKLFYDPVTKLHYVGEKKFDSVDQLVADGLIYMYIETRGADIIQKLSEASNYAYSPYYRVGFHITTYLCTKRPSQYKNN